MNMRNRIQQFMAGRYGVDSFSRFLLVLSIISVGCSMLFGKIFYFIALLLLVYTYFRMFSKNYEGRYKENMKFRDVLCRFTAIFRTQKQVWMQRRTHHVYSCPSCRQKIRIPRGRGKIIVTCPKCKMEFVKQS